MRWTMGWACVACLWMAACDGRIDLGSNDAGPEACSPAAIVNGPQKNGVVKNPTGGGADCGFAMHTSGFSGGAEDGGFVDPTDCAISCEGVAANGCGEDLGGAEVQCRALCAKSPTQSQLACLEASPCSAVVSGLQGKSVLCGIVGSLDGGPAPDVPDAGQGGPVVDPTDCAVTCEGAAANGCGEDLGGAEVQCRALCAKSPTQGEMTCLTDAPCSELLSALSSGGPICGIE